MIFLLTGVPTYWWPKYDDEVKDLLQVSEELQNKARTYLFEISSQNNISLDSRRDNLYSNNSPKLGKNQPTLVGIQIRRGDKSRKGSSWRIADKSYFYHAMDYFRSKFDKVYFVIVSEDKKWAMRNIIAKDIIYSKARDDLLELILLTLCDHTIMSVGTYSWWAAYLAGGEVVYYPNHTVPHTGVARFFNESQYFLPQWKPIL